MMNGRMSLVPASASDLPSVPASASDLPSVPASASDLPSTLSSSAMNCSSVQSCIFAPLPLSSSAFFHLALVLDVATRMESFLVTLEAILPPRDTTFASASSRFMLSNLPVNRIVMPENDIITSPFFRKKIIYEVTETAKP